MSPCSTRAIAAAAVDAALGPDGLLGDLECAWQAASAQARSAENLMWIGQFATAEVPKPDSGLAAANQHASRVDGEGLPAAGKLPVGEGADFHRGSVRVLPSG